MTARTLFTALTLTLALACGDKEEGTDGTDGTDGTASDGTDGTSGTDGTGEADSDGDGFVASEDCNDSDASINPDAEETCDGVDNNCDGAIDEGVLSVFYADSDGDGYGKDSVSVEACEAPTGFAASGGDCDDTDTAYNPGADESDCADPNDYNCDGSVGYEDVDGDGFAACEECNDSDAAINPDATEVCDEADVDEDCDGLVDDADDSVEGQMSYYTDADTDGYGDAAGTATLSCDMPSGMVMDNTDCDDGNIDVNPGATEVCDEADVDEDCNGAVNDADAGVTGQTTWNIDYDNDGYGASTFTQVSCEQPSGFVADATDCNDADSAINPGATEVCDDNDVDEDCSTTADDADSGVDTSTYSTFYADSDVDGYGDSATTVSMCDAPSGYTTDSTDCDDDNDAINPAASEVCDEVDNNCDGDVDEGAEQDFYLDADGDFFGDSNYVASGCSAPAGYTPYGGDCDDSDVDIFPYAFEDMSDGIDNDCDGNADSADTDTVTQMHETSDDDSTAYTATGSWSFPFCGSDWTSFYVHSNGQITFDFSHTDYSETSSEFLSDGMSIGMPWDDYRPAEGGAVYVTEHSDAVAVHFVDVPDWFATGENTFSVVMHEAGVIHFAVDDVESGDALIGWSCGDDSTLSSVDLSSEIDNLPEGAFGLDSGERAHFEYFSSGFDLEGYRWLMCATAGTDTDGDGWSDLCGDPDDSDSSVYPGAPTSGGSDSGDSGDSGF